MEENKALEEDKDKMLTDNCTCRLNKQLHIKSESSDRFENPIASTVVSPKDDTNVPEIIKYKSKPKGPWVTSEFLAMVIQRDMLHSRLKCNSHDVALRKEFTTCRNKTVALRRKLKRAYQTYLEEM